uniref:Uncharacterized protein n=1 Tax=Tetranychus urticae TaxID=32264 RepID=T1JWE3_TETUR
MDSKLYLIYVLLGFIRSSHQSDDLGWAKVDVKYYMNIKTNVDLQWMNRQDSAQWRNDSFVGDVKWPRSKVKIDENDNCYLYLFKNQTSTIHGPVKIDSKHIELDIKYHMSEINYTLPKDQIQEYELAYMNYIRRVLMESVFKVRFFNSTKDLLNIYLELDSETASLFPKIEKEDYFIISIINFVDTISLPLSEDRRNYVLFPENDPRNGWVVVSHTILNYTILSPDASNEIKV